MNTYIIMISVISDKHSFYCCYCCCSVVSKSL